MGNPYFAHINMRNISSIIAFFLLTINTFIDGSNQDLADDSLGDVGGDTLEDVKRPEYFWSCYKEDDCRGCVIGGNCSWCPVNNKCHDYGGSVKTPCTSAQLFNTSASCSWDLPVFDPLIAWKQIVLCSAAYSDDPQKCLNNAPMTPPDQPEREDGRRFEVVDRISSKCDGILGHECFAFTAVSHNLRVISLAFRGTTTTKQLLLEALKTVLWSRDRLFDGRVQAYFMDAIKRLWADVRMSVQKLVQKHPDYHVYVTGHSLGGALANLAAALLVDARIVAMPKLIQYTFGEPRVGNFDYAFQHDFRVNNSFRVTHYRDIVPHLPPLNRLLPVVTGPYHHGIEIFYDSIEMNSSTPYLVCQGIPQNEDSECSNRHYALIDELQREDYIMDRISDHKIYYGINVGGWPETDCHPGIPSPSPTSSQAGPYIHHCVKLSPRLIILFFLFLKSIFQML